MPFRIRPNSPTVLRLAAESARDPRTVVQAIEGRSMASVREGVLAAALRLGLSPADPIMRSLLGDSAPAPPPLRAV